MRATGRQVRANRVGIQSHGESLLTRLAGAVAKVEGREASVVKAEMVRDLSRTWVRAAATAIARRVPKVQEDTWALDRVVGTDILEA